ncbi:MAG: esterase/lipase family protein [Bdellovibrionales bacterium]
MIGTLVESLIPKKPLGKYSRITSTLFKELGANVLALNLYPWGFIGNKEEGYPHPDFSDNDLPILLVHGIVHNRSAFYSLDRKFRALGWHNIYTINYSTTKGSMSRMVGDLEKKIDQILKETNAPQVDIVAHSLGGLVSRKLMVIEPGRGKIRQLITLGTPHSGTRLSKFLRFVPGSSLFEDLDFQSFEISGIQKTSLPRKSYVTSIFSDFDWTIQPKYSCEAKGFPESAFSNIEIKGVGHTGLLYSRQVFEVVVEELSKNYNH